MAVLLVFAGLKLIDDLIRTVFDNYAMERVDRKRRHTQDQDHHYQKPGYFQGDGHVEGPPTNVRKKSHLMVPRVVPIEVVTIDSDTDEEDLGQVFDIPVALAAVINQVYAEDDDSDEDLAIVGVECSVCFSWCQDQDLITTGDCRHVFCRDCVVGHLTSKINDGDIDQLTCLESNCQEAIRLQLIWSLLPPLVRQRLEDLQLRKALNNLGDVHDCPRCTEPVECQIQFGLGECQRCEFFFCTSCRQQFHGAYECVLTTEETVQVRDAYFNGMDDEAQRILTEAPKRRKDDEESRQLIDKKFKKCPKCTTDVEKVAGCNKMRCRCGTYFCYVCCEVLKPGQEGYKHFTGKKCILWK